jgi:hypothetical protein
MRLVNAISWSTAGGRSSRRVTHSGSPSRTVAQMLSGTNPSAEITGPVRLSRSNQFPYLVQLPMTKIIAGRLDANPHPPKRCLRQVRRIGEGQAPRASALFDPQRRRWVPRPPTAAHWPESAPRARSARRHRRRCAHTRSSARPRSTTGRSSSPAQRGPRGRDGSRAHR